LYRHRITIRSVIDLLSEIDKYQTDVLSSTFYSLTDAFSVCLNVDLVRMHFVATFQKMLLIISEFCSSNVRSVIFHITYCNVSFAVAI